MSSVNIKVNADKSLGKQEHKWRYIGYDENNYTYTPEGKKLLSEFSKLEDGPYYVRAHHMLCSGNMHGFYKWGSTNIYKEDKDGSPIYNYEIVDRIIDVYLDNNQKPFFELGFMPFDLVSEELIKNTDRWNMQSEYKRKFWATPPKDYDKWYDLIYNLMKHLIGKYGKEEVKTWYFELWNEPDHKYYWKGTKEEFYKLYDYTEAAIHKVLEDAYLGGPGTTDPYPGSGGLEYLKGFLDHCKNGTNYYTKNKGTRLDYITFHTKGGGFPFEYDPKKETPLVGKFVSQVKTGVEAIYEYGYEDLEIVLSEADPDGWAAGGMYDNINMNFRNTEYYATYVAASYANSEKLARQLNVDIKYLAWAFMFRGERCFEGTRTFSTQGILKPVFNLFKMYSKLGYEEIYLESEKSDYDKICINQSKDVDISGIATKDDNNNLQILIYSHHDDWDYEKEFDINLIVESNVEDKEIIIDHYRIDSKHSNAYSKWIEEGKPEYPKVEKYMRIKKADELEKIESEGEYRFVDNMLEYHFKMPAHGVSLIEISNS